MKFFCAMMKKRKKIARFCTWVKTTIDEDGEEMEENLEEQSAIEEEVCEYYKKIYTYKMVEHTKEEILEWIGNDMKIIFEAEKDKL